MRIESPPYMLEDVTDIPRIRKFNFARRQIRHSHSKSELKHARKLIVVQWFCMQLWVLMEKLHFVSTVWKILLENTQKPA